ncbi:MAG: phage holin family protein [Caulobacterales bacterium]|nr:phage holin family protein [Caulobacterales bacterium]
MDDGTPLKPQRSIGDLIGELTGDLAALVRKESELIRAELGEKLNRSAKALGDIAAGGLLLMAALLVLLQALVLALSKVMDPTWAALLVGVAVAAVGYALVRLGMKAISLSGFSPERTTRQLRKDADLIKGNGK